ncbi:unnamed protein product, partial [Callosobruchus maculatus]
SLVSLANRHQHRQSESESVRGFVNSNSKKSESIPLIPITVSFLWNDSFGIDSPLLHVAIAMFIKM